MDSTEPARTIGDLIREWRKHRDLSQLALSQASDVSTRHLSRLETGLAEPSREMVLRLGRVLGIPPREQNAWLQAAGFASAYRETPLQDPEMAEVRASLEVMLKSFEPLPAAVVDKRYGLRMINRGWASLGRALTGQGPPALQWLPPDCGNVVVSLFDPAGLRPHLEDWEALAVAILDRVVRERTREPSLQPLIDRILEFPGVLPLLTKLDRRTSVALLVPLVLRVGSTRLALLSTITTLGTPQDLTLAELHIEVLHPTSARDAEALIALFPT